MLRSLRSRLLAGMIGSIAVLLAVFGCVVYSAVRRALVAELDAALAVTARTLAASVEVDDDEVEIEFDSRRVPEFGEAGGGFCYEFRRSDGTVLKRSASLGGSGLESFHGSGGAVAFRFLALPDGRGARAAGLRFRPAVERDDVEREGEHRNEGAERGHRAGGAAGPLVLVVARDAGGLEGHLASLRWILLAAGVGTMALASCVSYLIVGRGLAPLRSLAGRIARIGAADLGVRIGAAAMPAEMAPVVGKLNDLLGRLAAAFDRERAFTADVAHELRTPLAGLRTTIEVALADGETDGERAEALSDCLDITVRMQAMVETLLTLARLDAGEAASPQETIDLAELLDARWRPLADRARRRRLAFENAVPPGVSCLGRKDTLAVALDNVLDNAVAYADESGRIRAAARRADGAVEVTISNTGCRLPAARAEDVFERFWRGDTSRSQTGVHCGLGLALVRRIVTSQHGSVSAEIGQDGVFTIRLELRAGR